LYRDGHVNVGTWGSEVAMAPNVEAVVQNLVPMVDNGQLSPSATTNDSRVWGSTLGAATIVARSGLGVTATGALVYVAGAALSARTLAESLQRAGATRAMTLDINPEWVTFNFYNHQRSGDPSQIIAAKLYPRMQRPATRYLGPSQESREFFTVAGP
ncbi:MAG: phosphodiester glycosidase family protein, partial [Actinomycetota bacterium]|nr:phosphodiester glycosidase family protein [Actinomycetota bacterium]